MFSRTKILNSEILLIKQKELLHELKKGVLITPNLDHLIKIQKDKEFYDCYRGKSLALDGHDLPFPTITNQGEPALWIVCDSVILYLFSKLRWRKRIPEAIPGSSFFTAYYLHHRRDENCKIFLLGAAEGVAATAMKKINEKVGRQIVVGAHSPSYGFEKKPEEIEKIIDIVNNSGANVVLVGVGAPKQEKFIMTYRERMPGVDLWMALGATIDFEAGNIRRAPKWVNRAGLEWAFRITQQPRRMIKRYFGDDLVFFWCYFKQLIGVYKNPFREETKC